MFLYHELLVDNSADKPHVQLTELLKQKQYSPMEQPVNGAMYCKGALGARLAY